MDVGVHGYMVFAEIVVHPATQPVIGERLLVKRHTDAHHHAAEDLAARSLRVDDAASSDGVDDAGDAYNAQLLIHPHFREDCAMGVL